MVADTCAVAERLWWEELAPWAYRVLKPSVPDLVRRVLSLEAMSWELDMKLRQAMLRMAILQCWQGWPIAVRRLQDGEKLRDVLPSMFPGGTLVSIALRVVRISDPFEDSDNPEVVLALLGEIDRREEGECRRIGRPRYVLVAIIGGGKLVCVVVRSRKHLKIRDSRLVVARDVRIGLASPGTDTPA
jgi:hypothetical protein